LLRPRYEQCFELKPEANKGNMQGTVVKETVEENN